MDEVLAYDSEVPVDADEAVVLSANTLSPILTADNSPIIVAFLTRLLNGQQPWDLLATTSSAEAPLLEISLEDNYSEDEKITAVFLDSTHPSDGNTTHYSWQQDHTVSLADAQKATSTSISLENVPDRSIFPNVQTRIVRLSTVTSLSGLAPAQAYTINVCLLVYKSVILMADACAFDFDVHSPSNMGDNFPSTKVDGQVLVSSFTLRLSVGSHRAAPQACQCSTTIAC
ncbi:hypothetical protein KP509_12G019800 [Ceratopteris richardii]|uniref:Uncharacterized protein n=1 Tax=Ceratopteris richardii TaxID=49495 RepID=A0A8T2TJQ5_CERRI|nr:hypothetical protein KP509_12G019800 [Ceratopteris richardii]